MIKALFFLLSCLEQKKEPTEKVTPVREEVRRDKKDPPKLPEQRMIPLVYSPMEPTDPISLTIDVRQINIEIASSFLTEEVQAALVHPLQPTRDQFLSLVSIQEEKINTQGLLKVFRALNAYRSHAGNNSDLRIFHFWIAIDIGACRIFPKQQDAFTPITDLDACLEISGKKKCGTIEGDKFFNFPQSCLTLSP